jgi:prepilin signal peptidase PulO-like enzyme (type II secretory pathway)
VAFLWAGIDCAFAFSLLLLVFAMLHLGATKLGLANVERLDRDGRIRIPFAPSIAAALIGVLMLGCLNG